ncbi:hypothetical protein DFQ28_007813 [Apophysomyces sp. BC1034]|nr:hypothetical protein DFQ30_010807 [Apophysomyces sp. BC1015]KAG0194667.1 hypothetical protein DFQ28_007813 [Apophysomyces sp. BC1034]
MSQIGGETGGEMNQFKPGDRVSCVRSDYCGAGPVHLTCGHVYEVTGRDGLTVRVLDDAGEERDYLSSRFERVPGYTFALCSIRHWAETRAGVFELARTHGVTDKEILLFPGIDMRRVLSFTRSAHALAVRLQIAALRTQVRLLRARAQANCRTANAAWAMVNNARRIARETTALAQAATRHADTVAHVAAVEANAMDKRF